MPNMKKLVTNEDRLLETDDLYEAALEVIGKAAHDDSLRSTVAASLCGITLEHGLSIRALLGLRQVTSAIVLLRAQFEATVRALWVHYAASEGWVLSVTELIDSSSLKEPSAVKMDEMLAAIRRTAPPPLERMLRALKDGAWKPLNSYVHGGIHPITQQHLGYTDEYVSQTLRNANGLSMMAVMLLAMMSGDATSVEAIRQLQLDHLDCLPPLAPEMASS